MGQLTSSYATLALCAERMLRRRGAGGLINQQNLLVENSTQQFLLGVSLSVPVAYKWRRKWV